MDSIENRARALQRAARKLLFPTSYGCMISPECFRKRNTNVLRKANALFPENGNTPEEEAVICLSLLMGYHATIYNQDDKDDKIQAVLDRSAAILEQLSPSLLKCRLLLYCYGETYNERLAEEAYAIVDTWQQQVISSDKQEIIDALNDLKINAKTHQIAKK